MYIKKILIYFGSILAGILIFLVSISVRFHSVILKNNSNEPRLVWGSTPIINFSIWSRIMTKAGHRSYTMVSHYYEAINTPSDWDLIAIRDLAWLPKMARPVIAFILGLLRGDIFIISFDGFFLGNSPLSTMQAFFLKTAGKKIVVIPYGSDAYVYNKVRSTSLQHALMISYPEHARRQHDIHKNVKYWSENADLVIPGMMGFDGIGRWDVLAPSVLSLDLDLWKKSTKVQTADGINGEVNIVHAPNHRGFKGSEFIQSVIESLKEKGLKINYILLEKIQNEDVRKILRTQADILIEQIVYIGHGLNGLEGMASGITTISNLSNKEYTEPMERWSFLGECPLVSSNFDTLEENLELLVRNPSLRRVIGDRSRLYVEKYHGSDATQFLFEKIIKHFEGKSINLIGLFHPLSGVYKKDQPKICNSWKSQFK